MLLQNDALLLENCSNTNNTTTITNTRVIIVNYHQIYKIITQLKSETN